MTIVVNEFVFNASPIHIWSNRVVKEMGHVCVNISPIAKVIQSSNGDGVTS